MLSQQDLKQIALRGITAEQIENQLNEFKTGFPFLRLEAAAAVGNGIVAPNDEERKQYVSAWDICLWRDHHGRRLWPAIKTDIPALHPPESAPRAGTAGSVSWLG